MRPSSPAATHPPSVSSTTANNFPFVYDVADLYKAEFSLPAAFKAVARGDASVEKRTRELCRQKFKEGKLLQRILPDIDSLLDISNNIPESVGDIDEDGALPERWWNEESES